MNTLVGLGTLDPTDIVSLREISSGIKQSLDAHYAAVDKERENVSDPFLSKPLTRKDQVYMVFQFLESMSLLHKKSTEQS